MPAALKAMAVAESKQFIEYNKASFIKGVPKAADAEEGWILAT